MSKEPDGRVNAPSRTEAKTPLERAQQIQEMQRAMEAQPVATPAAAPVKQAEQVHQAQKIVEVFEAKQVQQVELKPTGTNPADQAAYASAQKDVNALFGPKGDDVEVKGNPWKIIPFGPPQDVAQLFDLKKPLAEYDFKMPANVVKIKEGNLFQVTAEPKNKGSEPAQKKAVVVDDGGRLKGAEFKSKGSLEKALAQIPSFAQGLFQTVFGEGVLKDDPKQHRIKSIEVGKKSAYEVKLERKNDLDGKWKTETVTLNNFGMRVPPSQDPRRHDINVAMYYLDRFQAA
jgi:hypothetical protein